MLSQLSTYLVSSHRHKTERQKIKSYPPCFTIFSGVLSMYFIPGPLFFFSAFRMLFLLISAPITFASGKYFFKETHSSPVEHPNERIESSFLSKNFSE